jgi:hypothetical protein
MIPSVSPMAAGNLQNLTHSTWAVLLERLMEVPEEGAPAERKDAGGE